MLGSDDLDKSKIFYDAIMQVLGYKAGIIDHLGRIMYLSNHGVLAITKPINGEKATYGNGMTIGFSVATPELVNEWHKVGLENGGTACEQPPGIRGTAERQLYLAYLRDPTGNKLCATHYVAK
jgi:catechol 2,3-dioxygenase-like lactoylglutathione lyase family enzyme